LKEIEEVISKCTCRWVFNTRS